MNTSLKTERMVSYALFMAIIIIMSVVPFLGFIQIPPLALTIIHIPVIIGTILYGWKAGLLFGTTFGLTSLFVAMTRGSATDLLFINPLISVVPRILFGLAIAPIYQFFSKIIKNHSLGIGVSAFVSSMVHSILVLTAITIYLSVKSDAGFTLGSFQQLILAIIGTNVIVEAVVSALTSAPIVTVLKRQLARRGQS